MREQWECMELCLGRGDVSAEKQWISGQSHMGYTVVSICCRQSGWFGKKQMRHLQMFTGPAPHGDWKPPDLCQRGNTAEHKLSRRFLQGNMITSQTLRHGAGKARAHLGLNLGRDVKGSKKSF